MSHSSGTEVAPRILVAESTSPTSSSGKKAPFFSSSPSKSSSEMVPSDAMADSLLMRLHKGRSVSLANIPSHPVSNPANLTSSHANIAAKKEKKSKKEKKEKKSKSEKEKKEKKSRTTPSGPSTSSKKISPVPSSSSAAAATSLTDDKKPSTPVSPSAANAALRSSVSNVPAAPNALSPPTAHDRTDHSSTDVTPRTSPSSSTHASPRVPPQPTAPARVVPPLRPSGSSGSIMSPPQSATSSSSPLTVSSNVPVSPKHLQVNQTPQQQPAIVLSDVSDSDGEETATNTHTGGDFLSREAPEDDERSGVTGESSRPTSGRRRASDDASDGEHAGTVSSGSSPVLSSTASGTPKGSELPSASSSLSNSTKHNNNSSSGSNLTRVSAPNVSDSDSSSSGNRRHRVQKQPPSSSSHHLERSAGSELALRAVSSAPATPTKPPSSSSVRQHVRSRRDSLGQSQGSNSVHKSSPALGDVGSPSSSTKDPSKSSRHREHGSSRSGSRSKTRQSGVHTSTGSGSHGHSHGHGGERKEHHRDSPGHERSSHERLGSHHERPERDLSRTRSRRHSVSATNNKELVHQHHARRDSSAGLIRSAKSTEDLANSGNKPRSPKQVSPRSPKGGNKSKDRQSSGSTIGKIDSSLKALTSFGFGIGMSPTSKRNNNTGGGSINSSPMRLERRDSAHDVLRTRPSHDRDRDIRYREREREHPETAAEHQTHTRDESPALLDASAAKIQQQRSWGKNSSSLNLVSSTHSTRSRSGSQLSLKASLALDSADAPLPPLPIEELAQELDDLGAGATQSFDFRDEAQPDAAPASTHVTPAELLTVPPLERVTGVSEALLEALYARNMALVGVIMDATEFDSGDSLSSALVCLFESSGRTTQLLTWALRREVAVALQKTNSLALFREDNAWNRLISVYCKQMCKVYFQRTLQRLMRRLAYEHRSYEVDPNRLNGRRPNTAPLRELTQLFLQQLLRSEAQFPLPVRLLCYYLRQELALRFPSGTLPPIGAFLFLRLICPALIMPTQYGILEREPTDEARRALILVAKVLQNLANGVQFGEKEAYMLEFNDIIRDYTEPLKLFLNRLTSPTGQCAAAAVAFEITREQSLSAQNIVRQFLLDKRKAIEEIITRRSPRANNNLVNL